MHYIATIRLVIRAADMEDAHGIAAVAAHRCELIDENRISLLSATVEFQEPRCVEVEA